MTSRRSIGFRLSVTLLLSQREASTLHIKGSESEKLALPWCLSCFLGRRGSDLWPPSYCPIISIQLWVKPALMQKLQTEDIWASGEQCWSDSSINQKSHLLCNLSTFVRFSFADISGFAFFSVLYQSKQLGQTACWCFIDYTFNQLKLALKMMNSEVIWVKRRRYETVRVYREIRSWEFSHFLSIIMESQFHEEH